MRHISTRQTGQGINQKVYNELRLRSVPRQQIDERFQDEHLVKTNQIGLMEFYNHSQVVVLRRRQDSWLVYTLLMVPLDWMTPIGIRQGRDYKAWPLSGRKLPAVLEFLTPRALTMFIKKLKQFYGQPLSELNYSMEELSEILDIQPQLVTSPN